MNDDINIITLFIDSTISVLNTFLFGLLFFSLSPTLALLKRETSFLLINNNILQNVSTTTLLLLLLLFVAQCTLHTALSVLSGYRKSNNFTIYNHCCCVLYDVWGFFAFRFSDCSIVNPRST